MLNRLVIGTSVLIIVILLGLRLSAAMPPDGPIVKDPPEPAQKPTDLAAVDVYFANQAKQAYPKKIVVGHVKNVGKNAYAGGTRTATLQFQHYKMGPGWHTLKTMTVGKLNPSQTVEIAVPVYSPAVMPGAHLRLVVSPGDSNPGNDVVTK